MVTTNMWITMSLLIKIIVTLSSSFSIIAVSSIDKGIPLHQNDQQDRSVYEVLLSIEEKISALHPVVNTPSSRCETKDSSAFSEIGNRIDAIETRLSQIEDNLGWKMQKIMEIINTNDTDVHQFTKLNNRLEIAVEKLLDKIHLAEFKSAPPSEQGVIDNGNLENILAERLDELAENLLKLDDRYAKMEEQWTTQINRINHTASLSQFCTKDVHLLRQCLEDITTSTTVVDEKVLQKSSEDNLKNHTQLPETVRAMNVVQEMEILQHTQKVREINNDNDSSPTGVAPSSNWNNITDILNETLIVMEKKFQDFDNDLEIYTRKVLNAYQEMLKDSKGIEDYLNKVNEQDNLTRGIVREGFRKIFHHMKPISTFEEILQSMHKKITDMGSTLDTSFASLLVAQNTFITTCHRVQQQEPQIEDKMYHLLQRITMEIEDKLPPKENNTMWNDFETHRRDVGRALHDLVWTVITVGNQTVEDVRKIVQQHNSSNVCDCQSYSLNATQLSPNSTNSTNNNSLQINDDLQNNN